MITPVFRRNNNDDENLKRKKQMRLVKDTKRVEALFSGYGSRSGSQHQQHQQHQQDKKEENLPFYEEFIEENLEIENNQKSLKNNISFVDINPYARNYLDLDNLDIEDF